MSEALNNQPQSPLPLNPDLMGYPTVEALVAAKRAGDAEAKRLKEENDKKDALLVQMATAANQRMVPDRRPSPQERLADLGVPVDALDEYVGSKVEERVKGVLSPLLNAGEARGKFIAQHPEYLQFENDVAASIEQDPVFAAKYWRDMASPNVEDRISAMEHAFLRFGDSRRRATPAPEGTGRPGLADAAIPTSRTGEGRRGPDAGSELQTKLDAFLRTGSPAAAKDYARARLGPVLREQFRQAGQEF